MRSQTRELLCSRNLRDKSESVASGEGLRSRSGVLFDVDGECTGVAGHREADEVGRDSRDRCGDERDGAIKG